MKTVNKLSRRILIASILFKGSMGSHFFFSGEEVILLFKIIDLGVHVSLKMSNLRTWLIFSRTVVVIGFQPDQYTVDEGAGSVNFTVLVIDGELDFDVVVEFFTEDGSAQGMHEAAK